MKFGYLPQSGFETQNLRSVEQLKDAIKSLQVSFISYIIDKKRQYIYIYIYLYKIKVINK